MVNMDNPIMTMMQPPPMMQPRQSGGVMNPTKHQNRQAIQSIHKRPNIKQHMMPAGAASPAVDGQGGQPNIRMMYGKPMDTMPPPPASPAADAKTLPGGPKQEDSAPQNDRVDSSLQNAAVGAHSPSTPSVSGTGQISASSPSQILNSSTPQM
ncbi:hypothetical protein BD309DRAFT_163735 [Dichomitus squalens]|uniref:Uncharacterized protein n=2 Tax=Dichomitus squalens TaxID=114155 RepID=A0A4V2K7N0_9APHY|nr:uncharacterized protein DICSQDRAFT_157020 [Dichomitus squalens LYAD-421 SS1]EJF58099.1 hypothetical protein DICSQDRAFT_157020 [Dichomitus squalens LYAD-421 SS1]TBU42653.1 hypothetical protein BD309DRAFT_163735 [Dichomitus squalens]TBU56768.1 hypothetical protein BD310DRAFT_822954 [Dichomitus squalens]